MKITNKKRNNITCSFIDENGKFKSELISLGNGENVECSDELKNLLKKLWKEVWMNTIKVWSDGTHCFVELNGNHLALWTKNGYGLGQLNSKIKSFELSNEINELIFKTIKAYRIDLKTKVYSE